MATRNGEHRGERGDSGRSRRWRNENPDDPGYEGTFRPEGEAYHTHAGEGSREEYRGRGQYMRGDRDSYRERGDVGRRNMPSMRNDRDEERMREPRDDRGYNFGDPYDQRNYESGGFGFGGTSGSAGGFGVGGAGPQSGGYGSQANYGEGFFGQRSSERDWAYGLGRDGDTRYEPGEGRSSSPYNQEYPYTGMGRGQPYGEGYARPRGRDLHHEQYLTWRDNHVRGLDKEYEAYRTEHQSKFDQDFDAWRRGRPAQGKETETSKATSSNPTAGGEEAERTKKNH